MNNLGTLILVLAFWALLVLLWIILYPLQSCSKWLQERRAKLGSSMFWNKWITLIHESFLVVTLCAMISIKYNFEFESRGQTVQTIFTVSTMTTYLAVSLYAYYRSMKDFESLSDREMKQQIGAFYEGIDVKRGKKVLLQPLSFYMRRIVLAYLVVAGFDELIYQVMMFIGSTILSESLLYKTEAILPISSRRLNTFSELIVLQVCYYVFCFAILDLEANFEVGYVPIIAIGFYMLVCLSIMIFGSFQSIKLKVKIFFVKRYHNQQRRHLQDYLKRNHEARRSRILAFRREEAPLYFDTNENNSGTEISN